ncbi:MAG: hypothetical protein ABJG78_08470 [Cyclobacteriaceae bacterium]
MRQLLLVLSLLVATTLTAQDIPLNSGSSLVGNSGSTSTQLLYWSGGSAYYGRKLTGMIGVNSHYFRIDGATKFLINNEGKVEINNTAPTSQLDIQASTSNQEVFRLSHPTSPAAAGYIVGFGTNGNGQDDSSVDFKVEFSSNTYNVLGIDRTSRDFFYNGEGNVGIGTIAPISKFDIQASASNQELFRLSHPTSPDAASFNIGFGTNGNGQDNSSVDFKVQYSSTTYDVLGIDRSSRDFYYNGDGNVGIGTITPDAKLAVNGTIHTKEVKVDLTGWSDFVFEKDYKLRTLDEVEKHISEKGHLPEIPSEADVTENGINLGEMDAKLLQKIEELTLYLIDMNKRMNQLETENQELKGKVKSLEKIKDHNRRSNSISYRGTCKGFAFIAVL